MVFWHIVGIIVSLLFFIAGIALAIFFFGVLAVALAGLISLFVILWFLFYLRRKWKSIVAMIQEKLYYKRGTKKKGKRHWEHQEEIIVKDVKKV